ncbi:MAG TPA: hypothetical protein VMV06_07645 [Acidimicrobiales bacterium]|nr:hypothetical protein [Acidimicrobiales bacterium]
MSLVFDAGGLIALERDERASWVRLKAAYTRGEVPLTNAAVLGQVWRGGPRQARLSLALAGMDIRPLGEGLGRAAGELLGATRRSDLIDASIVLVASDGDEIVTSDPGDLRPLAVASGIHVELVHP